MKVETLTKFSDLGLAENLLRALQHEGYETPTPIQAQSIPSLLQGRDLLGIAQTGTGKTAAFALPILDRLLRNPQRPEPKQVRALVLAPTRELAAQIAESFRAYARSSKIFVGCVVGGVSLGPQRQQLARGLDVLVATPGRLLDHMGSGAVRLDRTEVVVLDEADHMLDLGFIIPIRQIVAKLPKARQNLFFSATMPKEIATLADEMLKEPVTVKVTPEATTAERIAQEVFHVEAPRKREILVEILQRDEVKRTIVFTRTKRGADRVAEHLEANGVNAAAIHGNKSQGQRQRALDGFRNGRTPVLVATDIAARGIDVDGVTHVVNFELPEVPESYVHRIGRTARAGADGAAFSLCAEDERHLLRAIEKLTRQAIPALDRRDPGARPLSEPARKPAGGGRGQGRGQGQGQQGRPEGKFSGRPSGKSFGKPFGKPQGERAERGFGDRPERAQGAGQGAVAHGKGNNGQGRHGQSHGGEGQGHGHGHHHANGGRNRGPQQGKSFGRGGPGRGPRPAREAGASHAPR